MEDFAEVPLLMLASVLRPGRRALRNHPLWYAQAWAQELGLTEAATLLDQTLQEEKETDTLLTRLAEARVNMKAA